jgi:hypothetical protein
MSARSIATAAAVALAALTGSTRAAEPDLAAWAVNLGAVPPHPTCAQIVGTLAPSWPRWAINDGFSLNMMLADDFKVWYHHGISGVDWSNCDAVAAGIDTETCTERWMATQVDVRTKAGMTTRQAMDQIALEVSRLNMMQSGRPIIPKYDINPWTNKPYAQGTTP